MPTKKEHLQHLSASHMGPPDFSVMSKPKVSGGLRAWKYVHMAARSITSTKQQPFNA